MMVFQITGDLINMTQSEKNDEFGKILAHYLCDIDKFGTPIIVNSEQYESFKKELSKLNNKK